MKQKTETSDKQTHCSFCGKFVHVSQRTRDSRGELLHSDSRLCLND